MNKNCHRLIFSKRLGTWVAVFESCRAAGKRGRAGGVSGKRFARTLIDAAAASVLIAGTMSCAQAQVSVPDGTNLSTIVDSNTTPASTAGNPANGSVWNLTGTNYAVGSTITLPTGTLGLTLDAIGGAATVVMSSVSTFSSTGSVIITLTGDPITLTRNGASSNSPLISSTVSVTLNASEGVSFSNINTTGVSQVNGGITAPVIVINGALTAANNNTMFGVFGSVTSWAQQNSASSFTQDNGDVILINNAGGNSIQQFTTYNGSGAIQIYGNVSLAATSGNVTIAGNTAIAPNGTGNGGAISSNGNVSIGNSNSIVTIGVAGVGASPSNTATLGGAIFSGGTTSITGSTIILSNNQARSNGGGIYAGAAGAITITGALFADNNVAGTGSPYSSGGSGGAFYATAGGIQATGSLEASGNTAATSGGAFYALAGNITQDSGTVIMTGNQAKSGNGGAIDAAGGNVNLTATSGSTVLAGNSASGTTTATGNGGAIYASGLVSLGNSSGVLRLGIDGSGNSNANTATNNGGAIWAGGMTALTGSAIALSNNTAKNGGGVYSTQAVTITGAFAADNNAATSGSGGAIYAVAGGIQATGSLEASGNTASVGGGVFYAAAGNVTQDGGTVIMTGNQAKSGMGGAINAVNGNVSLTGASGGAALTGNIASNNGGAIYAAGSSNGNVSIGNSAGVIDIENNYAGYTLKDASQPVSASNLTLVTTGAVGGAIEANGGAVSLTGSAITLSNNQAAASGGGIVSARLVTIIGALFADNNIAGAGGVNSSGSAVTTTGSGGAIYASAGGIQATGSLEASGNTASSAGGAFFVAAGDLTQSGGAVSLTGNQAKGGNGGAIDTFAGNVGLNASSGNAVLSGNTASLAGGAIYANGNVTVGSTNGTFALIGNTATNGSGGGIYSTGSVTLSGASGSTAITGNRASGSGGAVYANNNVVIGNANGVLTLSNNTAIGGSGGAIYSGRDTTLYGTSISNNEAAGNGGAINASGSFTLNTTASDTINQNTAGGLGGAIYANNNVTLNAVNGGISFSGNTQYDGSATVTQNADGTLNFAGGTAQANAIYLYNNGKTPSTTLTLNTAGYPITFYDPIQNNIANGLVTVLATGRGIVTFDASKYAGSTDLDNLQSNQWSQVYGNTTVSNGTSFAVQNNAVYGMMSTDAAVTAARQTALTSFTVDSGSTLAGGIMGTVRANIFNLNGALSVAGSATPGNASGGFSVFNVVSPNVTFGSDSTVQFNTYLNDGGTQLTDLLNLNLAGSATSGTANILVSNVNGPGAVTTGNGIELVQANNGTTDYAFTLGRRVVAGPYEYTLYQRGVAGAADTQNAQNWFLRSTLDCSLDANAVACGGPGPGGPSSDPDGGTGTPPTVPDYRPETSLYTAIPPMLLNYSAGLLDTLHERMGDEAVGIAPQGGTGLRPSLGWARVILQGGAQGDANKGIYGAGPRYRYAMSAVQAGLDLYRAERKDGGSDHAGAYFAVGSMNANVQAWNGFAAGSNTLTGYTVGGYWTHFNANGWYTDAVAQYTWADLSATPIGINGLKTNGVLFAASLEAGKAFKLNKGWNIEPQTQWVYQTGSMTSASDPGANVRFSGINSFSGRLGVRVAKSWNPDSNDLRRTFTLWARPSLGYTFTGNPNTSFSSATGYIPFHYDLRGGWAQIAAGLDAQITRSTTIYASGFYQTSLNSNRNNSYGGKIGVRVVW